MAKDEKGPDAFAHSTYIMTLIGVGLFCGSVILFVL